MHDLIGDLLSGFLDEMLIVNFVDREEVGVSAGHDGRLAPLVVVEGQFTEGLARFVLLHADELFLAMTLVGFPIAHHSLPQL